MIKLGNEKLIAIDLFGAGKWYMGTFGWLGTYILCSIVFSMGLRKVLKVY
jgi:uncharacterized membrane protein (DUF106 family)